MYEAVYQFIDNYSYLVEALWITDPVGRSFLPRENTVIFLHSFLRNHADLTKHITYHSFQ